MFWSTRKPNGLILFLLLAGGIVGVIYPFYSTHRTPLQVKQAERAIAQFTSGLHFTGAPDSVIRSDTPGKASAAMPANAGDYTVTAPNELTPDQINTILAHYGSPASGEGQAIYDLGQRYNIDDAYFLADYMKESSLGKSTLASPPYYNPTGMECSDLADSCTGADGNGRNWGAWNSRESGFAAWYQQISQRYVSGAIDGGYRLTTIYLIACGPNGTGMYDGGSGCSGYASDIEHFVDTWRTGGF
jgi:hypothetical protein